MPCLKRATIAVLALNIALAHAEALQIATQRATQQASQPSTGTPPLPSTTLDSVIHIAGLAEIKPNVKGSLTLTPQDLVFSSAEASSSIPRDRISGVFVGDQRTEPWGATGRIVRMVIPDGGGMALGAMTNQKVDLLTVEYRDIHGGYHGVVFVVPAHKVAAIRDQLQPTSSASDSLSNAAPAPACPAGEALPRSVLVEPITAPGIELPAEYHVLAYEQLLKQLKAKRPSDSFFRFGDRSAGPGCTALTLHVNVTGFKKGNRALRASTGPLSLFLGTTSLTFDVDLQDSQNKSVFHAHIKRSNRRDSDSLGLSDTIAKKVAKQLNQALKTSDAQTANLR